MSGRANQLDVLVRDVAAAFHRLPNCPTGLTAAPDAVGNVVLALRGRTFTVAALVVEQTILVPGWCENVLKVVLGGLGRQVEEVRRRALISAALTAGELTLLVMVGEPGWIRFDALSPAWIPAMDRMVENGLLIVSPEANPPHYAITDAGLDAIAARRV